jgi:hypothetical protein
MICSAICKARAYLPRFFSVGEDHHMHRTHVLDKKQRLERCVSSTSVHLRSSSDPTSQPSVLTTDSSKLKQISVARSICKLIFQLKRTWSFIFLLMFLAYWIECKFRTNTYVLCINLTPTTY